MVRVTQREWIGLAAAAAGLFVGWRTYRWGIEKGDPRYAIARRIAREADARRDVVVTTDEATHLFGAFGNVPALHGQPVMDELTGFRRIYVIGTGEASLLPFMVRLGTPTVALGPGAVRWDTTGLARTRWDLSAALGSPTVAAHREGGVHEGPCPWTEGSLQCRGDPWNHVRVEPHTFSGVAQPCVFAHPQADGRLVIEAELPPARALVGIVGMDDAAYYPTGTPVIDVVRVAPVGAPAFERTVVAENRRGAAPYRIDLGGRASAVRFTITTRNAGARQFCFTARATE